MSILLGNPFFLNAGAAGGYQISRSLRFNSADSAYLSRTPASAGNRKTWTWAGWVKRSALGTFQYIWGNANSSAENGFMFRFDSGDVIRIADWTNTAVWQKITSQVFRDVSAWYHIVISYDTTNATAADRVRLYVNGTRVTAFSTSTDPTQNYDGYTNNTSPDSIGRWGGQADYYLNGYLADIHFIDGQALTPSSFTEVSATTGQLIPKAYTGTFGTNGFWLKFADNSSNTATTLGADSSGNGNNWTPNNLSIGGSGSYARYLVQTSGNGTFFAPYAAFDGDVNTAGGVTGASGTGVITFTPASAISASSLRVYLYTGETGNGSPVSISVNGGTFTNCTTLGAANDSTQWVTATSLITGGQITSIAVQRVNMSGFGYNIGAIEVNGSQLIDSSFTGNDSLTDTPTSYGTDTGAGGEVRGNYATWNPLALVYNTPSLSNGNLDSANNNSVCVSTIGIPPTGKWYCEVSGTGMTGGICPIPRTTQIEYNIGGGVTGVIGIAVNRDADEVKLYKDNVLQSTTSISGAGIPTSATVFIQSYAGGTLNAGQRPFAYTAPSGFKALCDTNLPSPQVAKPSTVMDVVTYAGDGGSTRTISGLQFSPDLVWTKARSQAYGQNWYDVIRGGGKVLRSDITDAELTNSPEGYVSSFTSDGYVGTAGSNSAKNVNENGTSYVAWCWDAGSTTVTNTQGSITSSVRANPSAGFSVITWTGTGSAATVGHGLGIAPHMAIIKRRDASGWDWPVWHNKLTSSTYNIFLNSTNAEANRSDIWSSAPTSALLNLGDSGQVNGSSGTYVAYAFAPVTGYSSFGSYVGNGSGSNDGPFVYTGFRPKWVMVKASSSDPSGGGWWNIIDATRNTYNAATSRLGANSSSAENSSYQWMDLLSNGFKLRELLDGSNVSGVTYIYAAFAESPFAYSRAR